MGNQYVGLWGPESTEPQDLAAQGGKMLDVDRAYPMLLLGWHLRLRGGEAQSEAQNVMASV